MANDMSNGKFIEEVYELAFGDNAIARGFSHEEVLATLREFSDKALAYDEGNVGEQS